jgi:hypothetical protein
VSVRRNYLDRPVPVIGAGTLVRRIALMFAPAEGWSESTHATQTGGPRRWTTSSNNATNCQGHIQNGYRAEPRGCPGLRGI